MISRPIFLSSIVGRHIWQKLSVRWHRYTGITLKYVLFSWDVSLFLPQSIHNESCLLCIQMSFHGTMMLISLSNSHWNRVVQQHIMHGSWNNSSFFYDHRALLCFNEWRIHFQAVVEGLMFRKQMESYNLGFLIIMDSRQKMIFKRFLYFSNNVKSWASNKSTTLYL